MGILGFVRLRVVISFDVVVAVFGDLRPIGPTFDITDNIVVAVLEGLGAHNSGV